MTISYKISVSCSTVTHILESFFVLRDLAFLFADKALEFKTIDLSLLLFIIFQRQKSLNAD